MKGMLKAFKLKPAMPLLAILLILFYISPVLAQNGNELKIGKKISFSPQSIDFNNLKITFTPEMVFNQDDNTHGSVTISFKVEWSEPPKNERIYIINDKSQFNAYYEQAKGNWNVSKKVKEQIQQTFNFSPAGVVQYTPGNIPLWCVEKVDPFNIGLITYPTEPVTMSATFFLGSQTKLKGFDIDEKAKTLSWEFSLPKKYSQDCKGRYNEYQSQLESLNPESNERKFEEFKDQEEQTKEDFDKIKDKNERLNELLRNIKTDIREMGCEDLQKFIDVYEEFSIDKGSLDQVGSSIKQVQKVKKEQEEVVTTQSTTLSENFSNIQELYRDLVKLKWKLIETKADFEVVLGDKRDNFIQIRQSGNSAYEGFIANQPATNNIKLMKKGFDKFCFASESLLDSLDAMQKQIKLDAQESQQASTKKKGGWVLSLWYIIPSLILIVLAIVLVKYWSTIMKALSIKKKVNS
jgi:hypothetical protein